MRKMNRVVPLVQNHPVKLCLQGAGADGIMSHVAKGDNPCLMRF